MDQLATFRGSDVAATSTASEFNGRNREVLGPICQGFDVRATVGLGFPSPP